MKKFKSLSILAILLVFGFQLSVAQDYNIYFDFNSDVMRLNDVGKLHKVLAKFNNANHSIHLVGHTDTIGNYKYNLELSEKRTNAVMNYLVKNGMKSSYISMDFKGKNQPVTSDQFYNRRVEVYIRSKKGNIVSFNDFRQSLIPKVQKYLLPSTVGMEIEGDRGTIITIPANSFVTSSGKAISGDIVVSLIEYYSIKDFFSKGLSTVSGGNLLTSAGMVELSVMQNNTPLKLKSDSDIGLAFPKTNDIRYHTFYASKLEDGSFNWVPDKRKPEYGATFAEDGVSLIVTEKNIAVEKNSQIRFNPITQKVGIPTDVDNEAINQYYAEQKKVDEARKKYYNLLKSNNLGLINCDAYVNNPSVTPVKFLVQISNTDVQLVSATLIFRRTNSFLELGLKSEIMAFTHTRIPIGEIPELLVIGVKGNQPYFSHSFVTLTTDNQFELELVETTFDAIDKKM